MQAAPGGAANVRTRPAPTSIGERFDRAGWLRLNREYPGGWHVHLRTVLDAGEWVVTEVDVTFDERPDGRPDRGVSLLRWRDGRLVELREYWPEPFSVPGWRAGWSAG
jgi:hypothetical protein